MRLWFYRGVSPNFGDELNQFVWPKLLGPTFFDNRPDLFLGIGSILFNVFDKNVRKIVAGAGYGGYTPPPTIDDGSWDVRFVRGPQTARQFGLDARLAVADPAILTRVLVPPAEAPGRLVSYMPHWWSAERGNWQLACKLAGINMIDPRHPVEEVIAQLQASRVVITEAMHGAIVADALRIPWVAVRPLAAVNHMKWFDWAQSLDIDLRPQPAAPSNLLELQRAWQASVVARNAVLVMRNLPIDTWLDTQVAHHTARHLQRLAAIEPMLSPDSAMDRATTRLLEEVERLKAGQS